MIPRLALAACLLVAAGEAVADEGLVRKLGPTIDQAFFHLSVSGEAREGVPDLRNGKGFGIGPDLVITSQHLVGDDSEWAPEWRPDLAPEIVRAMRPLSRRIELTRRAEPDRPLRENFVRPVPMASIDATAIVLPELEMSPYFQLSICPIAAGETYFAVLTLAPDPASVRSVREVGLVELRAAGFRPPDYGPLNVFDIVGTTDFAREAEGHDGSPILDAEGNVVAVVSALTAHGSGHRVLATPIQPFFPGAMGMLALAVDDRRTSGDRLACSLADTVRRLYDSLSSHAFWEVSATRDSEGRIDEIYLEYDTILAEPDIVSVEARIEYWGNDMPDRFQDAGAAQTSRLPVPNLPAELKKVEITDQKEGASRTFVTDAVGIGGRLFVENWVREEAGPAGRIDFVEIMITPRFGNASVQGRPIAFRLPYFAPTQTPER